MPDRTGVKGKRISRVVEEIFWRRPDMSKFRKLLNDKKGATAIEYGLIAALIAVACIGALSVVGEQLNTTFNSVGTELTNANT
jgi:pilus assembly protein Flp/PilA